MRAARLELALREGLLVLPPTGDIAVIRPRAGDDLSVLPQARVVVLTGFRPDADHFAARGFRTTGSGPVVAAIVCLPRAKADALARIYEARASVGPAGLVLIDGQKTDGIDAIAKQCRAAGLAGGEVLSKAHGKIFALGAGPIPPEWAAVDHVLEGGFVTRPGVFSADGPDRGSVLLADALPAKLPPRVADLGAGWGYLARAILSSKGVQSLDLVEAEAEALECARRNITDTRAAFHWADATTFRPTRPWDAVVMNPPFHLGREAEPDLGIAVIRAAHRGLAPGGVLWLVANRHLPYAPVLASLFREVEEIGGDSVFRLTRAAHPLRQR